MRYLFHSLRTICAGHFMGTNRSVEPKHAQSIASMRVVTRRRMLAGVSGAGAALVGQRFAGAAFAATPSSLPLAFRVRPRPKLLFAGVDINAIEAIDTHSHPGSERTISEVLPAWGRQFASHAIPARDFPGRAELIDRTAPDFARDFDLTPSSVGLRNYVARTYGLPAENSSIDAVIRQHAGKDFGAYYRAKLDYERIAAMVVQSGDVRPVRPKLLVPDDRFVWTYALTPLLLPDWPKAQGIADIDAYARAVEAVVTECAANDCRGLKLALAYFRPLSFARVERDQAEAHFRRVLVAAPVAHGDSPVRFPIYGDPETTAALWACQDYLIHRVLIAAGKVGLPIIIHCAAAMAPDLQPDFNDPRGLYKTFTDPDVALAGTRFVLIHTGFPFHAQVASFISQFPNVFTDLSFFSHDPGILEETLRLFLAVAPSSKIMHGSDWSNPEQVGYAVSNTRAVLHRILRDYRDVYAWRERDCLEMAYNILNRTARRVFRVEQSLDA
ncbi:MAG: amidohydrolase family protein [Novosphingobium sp.]